MNNKLAFLYYNSKLEANVVVTYTPDKVVMKYEDNTLLAEMSEEVAKRNKSTFKYPFGANTLLEYYTNMLSNVQSSTHDKFIKLLNEEELEC